jgi:hypothetical protein
MRRRNMARCEGCGNKFSAGDKAVEVAAYHLYCSGCVANVVVYGHDEEKNLPIVRDFVPELVAL